VGVLWISNGLIGLGMALLIGTGAVFGYSQYEQAQAQREVAALAPDVPTAWTPVAAPTTAPTATAAPTLAALPVVEATGIPVASSPTIATSPTPDPPTPTLVPTATPVPIYPAERIVATPIGLDSKVVEAPIVEGEWVVPKFVAGHLSGTAQPLQGSNVVMSGHVQSISSGNVFARIGELKVGDIVRLYTKATVITYVVEQLLIVANNDIQVAQPSAFERLTLITCTGTWLPLQHDYSQRIVVIAAKAG